MQSLERHIGALCLEINECIGCEYEHGWEGDDWLKKQDSYSSWIETAFSFRGSRIYGNWKDQNYLEVDKVVVGGQVEVLMT